MGNAAREPSRRGPPAVYSRCGKAYLIRRVRARARRVTTEEVPVAGRQVQTFEMTVRSTRWLTPHLVRVVFGGPGFTPNGFTDAYVKLDFGTADAPLLRTYTVRGHDPQRDEIAIDFVVHGDEGVAGPWAARAEPGERLRLRGPGGAYAPDPSAAWHLLAGDESALPAVASALAALPADAAGHAVLEVGGLEDEVALEAPAGITVQWLHRGAAEPGSLLVDAVRAVPWRDGVPHVFVHGEAQAVMKGIRPYVRAERGVPPARASISGYWRRGRTEEGFRTWKRELADAEATARA